MPLFIGILMIDDHPKTRDSQLELIDHIWWYLRWVIKCIRTNIAHISIHMYIIYTHVFSITCTYVYIYTSCSNVLLQSQNRQLPQSLRATHLICCVKELCVDTIHGFKLLQPPGTTLQFELSPIPPNGSQPKNHHPLKKGFPGRGYVIVPSKVAQTFQDSHKSTNWYHGSLILAAIQVRVSWMSAKVDDQS